MSGGCDQEAALLPMPSVHATLLMENSIITTNRLRKRVQPCTRCLEILMTIAILSRSALANWDEAAVAGTVQ